MEVGKLNVQVRNTRGKGTSRRLRAQGRVPGICYGEPLGEPLAISVDPKELKKALDPAKRRNTVIQVTVDPADGEAGDKRELTAMLKDFQIDTLQQEVLHVDLLAIDVDKEVEIDIPVRLIGKAVGTVEGGQIHVVRHDVLVSCKPADIPNDFELDITPLDIGDALHVSDIKLPPGVALAISDKLTLVTCVAPKAEKAEATTEEAAAVPAEGAAAEAKPAEGAAAAAAPAAADKGKGEKGGDKAKK